MAQRFSTSLLIMISSLYLAGCSGRSTGPGADAPSHDAEDANSTAETAQAGSGDSDGEASGRALPPVGTQNLDIRAFSMEFGLTLLKDDNVAAGVQTGNWSFEEERTHRVKALGKRGIQELEVVYGKWEAKPLLGLQYEVPTDGKTYAVQATEDEPSVKRSGQEPMTSEELEAVIAEYGYVGDLPPTLQALEATGHEQGAELPADVALTDALLGAIPGVTHRNTKMTARFVGFDESGRKTAKLTLSLTTTLQSGETAFEMTLKGPASVDYLTGWVSGLDLEGEITPSGKVKAAGKMLNVRGKGTVKYVRSADFKQ